MFRPIHVSRQQDPADAMVGFAPRKLHPDGGYGNFDMILDHFSRYSQLHTTPHAQCDIVSAHVDWILIGACNPML